MSIFHFLGFTNGHSHHNGIGHSTGWDRLKKLEAERLELGTFGGKNYTTAHSGWKCGDHTDTENLETVFQNVKTKRHPSRGTASILFHCCCYWPWQYVLFFWCTADLISQRTPIWQLDFPDNRQKYLELLACFCRNLAWQRDFRTELQGIIFSPRGAHNLLKGSLALCAHFRWAAWQWLPWMSSACCLWKEHYLVDPQWVNRDTIKTLEAMSGFRRG